MKSFCLGLFFTFFFVINAIAQQSKQITEKKIDSLLALNNAHKTQDSIKLALYDELVTNYTRLDNVVEIDNYAKKIVTLAQKLNKPIYIALSYYRIGKNHHFKDRYLLAEENYRKAIEKYQELKDKRWMASIYMNLSAMYADIPDNEKALETNLKAIKLYNELNDIGSTAGCYVNIASIYYQLKQYGIAISYLEKAIPIFKNNKGNEYGIALANSRLGEIYANIDESEYRKLNISQKQQYEKALYHADQALKYNSEEMDLLGKIYEIQAKVYNSTGNKVLALRAYQKTIKEHSHMRKNRYALSLLSLANFHIEENELAKAKPLLTEALAIADKLNLLKVRQDAYLAFSNLSEKEEKHADALNYFKQYIAVKEEIFNEEKEREITRKQMQLDFNIKENEYQTQQKLTNTKLEKQLLLAKQQQQQLVLNQQKLVLAQQERDIQRLDFLREQAVFKAQTQQKENRLKQQQLQANLVKKQNEQQLLIRDGKIRTNRNLSVFMGVLAMVLLGGAILIYKTQRKTQKLNQLVSAQKSELESLGKVKDRIFSVVSHDMRSPVNSLIAFISLLESGNVSEEKLKRYANHLKTSLGYTSTMMENLLNWAYSQMQGFKPNIEQLPVAATLADVVLAGLEQAKHKNIQLHYNPTTEINVLADKDMLLLVARNLLGNAIKFTSPFGQITLNIFEKEKDVHIEFADNGIGMSTEQMHLFNQQTDGLLGKTTLGTQQEKGTGLGLSLCKSFANLMNGTLQVSANPNGGTIFLLILPKPTEF